MRLNVSFSLIHLKNTINGKEYEYNSKGGRIMLLGIILGFVTRYLEYHNMKTWLIIVLSIVACILWDAITVGLYLLKIKKIYQRLEDDFNTYVDNKKNNQLNSIKNERIVTNTQIKSTREIVDYINQNILSEVKVPHSTSQPVVYQENGNYYLAVFVFFYSREDVQSGKVNRPTLWVISDIKTGEIIEKRYTNDIDFSSARYDVRYDVRVDGKYDMSKEYYEKTFAMLDSVRNKLIATGQLDDVEYRSYLDRIVANIPKEYQRFYFDLSC